MSAPPETKEAASKSSGLQLNPNGRTSFENFLLGVETDAKKAKDGIGRQDARREAMRLYTKTPWSEGDLETCQGVLCDDGSALRRFHTRIKHRVVNAGFETAIALEMHSQLCESLR